MSKRIKISEEKAKILETICIIALIVFAVLVHIITKNSFGNRKDEILITLNDMPITKIDGQEISLKNDGTYTISSSNGAYNIIEIKDKKVRCIEANCPDGICEKHGFLRDDIDNDMIICAPHGLIIEYKK